MCAKIILIFKNQMICRNKKRIFLWPNNCNFKYNHYFCKKIC